MADLVLLRQAQLRQGRRRIEAETGRLHAVDGLTKTLFVADGQLG